MIEPLTCLLCGTTNHDVEHTWVRWLEPVEGQNFSTIYRCKDRAACHRRVELNGDRWEVDDTRLVTA